MKVSIRRRWRTVSAGLAASVLLASIAACGGSTTNSSGGPEGATDDCGDLTAAAEEKDVELTMWVLPLFEGPTGEGGDYMDWAEAVAAEFHASHPSVTVKPELLTFDGYQQKLKTLLAAGSRPDVVMTIGSLGGVAPYQKIGALEPIDCFLDDTDRDDFDPATDSASEIDGQNYLFPWYYLTSGLGINVDLVKEAGVEELVPTTNSDQEWTFDEFRQVAEATTSPGDTYGYAVNGVGPQFYNYLWMVNNEAPMTDEAITEYLWGSEPRATEAFDFLKSLVDDGLAPGGSASLDIADAYNLFIQGKIAMFPINNLAAVKADVEKSSSPFEVGVVAPPHGADSTTHVWTNTGGFMVFKQDDPFERQMAMELAKLATNTTNSEIVSSAVGVFPGRVTAQGDMASDPNLAPFLGLGAYADNTFTQGYGLLTQAEWENNIQSVLTDQMSPEEALQSLQELVDKSLAQ